MCLPITTLFVLLALRLAISFCFTNETWPFPSFAGLGSPPGHGRVALGAAPCAADWFSFHLRLGPGSAAIG